jgi:acetylornithine deacetylase/succinyl-diaminopimelate desuccinylase-like protein
MRAELQRDIETIAAIPDRGSASAGERTAAEYIKRRFEEAGVDATIETERVHGSFYWPIGLLNAVALIASAGARSTVSRAAAAAVVAALVDDVDHRRRFFRRLLPRRDTYNVTAETGDPNAPSTVVIVAHHDAAHGGQIFDTTLIEAIADRAPQLIERQKRWPPMMWGVVIGPLLLGLGKKKLGRIWTAGAIAAMVDIARTPVVPGANDNAAAVATVLELARRRYEGVRVLLVSTGSEESNADGMKEWGERHFPELPRESTYFIALETLGSGNLAIAEAEGFLYPHPYDADLKDRAQAAADAKGLTASRGLDNSFMSDAIVPLHAGYPTMLLGALNDIKLPANYHKPWDTPDKIDYSSVEDAVELLDGLIRQIAR